MTPQAIPATTPEQQAEVIRACWLAWNPEPPFLDQDAFWRWKQNQSRLETMLDCGAYLSAVEMMVPAGHIYFVTNCGGNAPKPVMGRCTALCGPIDSTSLESVEAASPALALLAAIAQVKEQDDD